MTNAPTLDAARATCSVYTFKDGFLSAVAHDLKLAVGGFTLTIGADGADPTQVEGTADAASLTVAAVMRDAVERQGVLGSLEQKKIVKNIRADVLKSRRHPTIRFTSTQVVATTDGTGWSITGDLSLCGRTRSMTVEARRSGDSVSARFRLHQPDFGIKPFKAMMGTLKIKPDVEVLVEVPLAE